MQAVVSGTATDALLRHMDLYMYVLYSRDEVFVLDMVRQVVTEVCERYNCPELMGFLKYTDQPLLFKCLFFFMVNFLKRFRFWTLSEQTRLPLVCPHKATRFLTQLKNELIPNFLVDERMRLEEFERAVKVAYIAA